MILRATKKKNSERFKMGAKHPWADICTAVFQAPAKLISHHHLQVSEGPSTFSVKQGSEVQAKKPKEIYRYMVKARSVSQAPNERENAERKGVHWTLPVRGSSQTASTPSLLCTDRGLVAELASCSPCLFFSLPSHTFVLWFPASLAIS